MDAAKARWLHFKTSLMAGLGAMVDGYDYSVIAIALLGIIPLFDPSATELALLAASAYAGGAVGGIVIGALADRFGRRPLFIVTLSWFVVMAPITALAQDVWQLIILRFFLGFAMGGDFPLTASYVNEMAPVRDRGRLAGFAGACWWPGAVVAMLVGAVFYAFMDPEVAWRWILAIGAVPALISLLLRMGLPESTRWLLVKGRVAEALAVVREVNPDISEADIRRVTAAVEEQRTVERSARFSELFGPTMWRRTLFGAGFFTCYTLSYYAMGAFGGILLRDFGDVTSLSVIALGSGFYFLMASIGAMTSAFTVDRVGRRPILLLSFTGMATVLVLMAVVFPPGFVWGMILLGLFHFFQAGGPGSLWALYIGELFPNRLRASGHGLATMSSRSGAVASSFIFQGAVVAWGLNVTFLVHASFAALGLLLTLWLGIETKNRTLEDIADDERPAATVGRTSAEVGDDRPAVETT
jgi:putative MFS transporter